MKYNLFQLRFVKKLLFDSSEKPNQMSKKKLMTGASNSLNDCAKTLTLSFGFEFRSHRRLNLITVCIKVGLVDRLCHATQNFMKILSLGVKILDEGRVGRRLHHSWTPPKSTTIRSGYQRVENSIQSSHLFCTSSRESHVSITLRLVHHTAQHRVNHEMGRKSGKSRNK